MSVSAVRAMAARRKWWAALLVALALTGALAPRAGAVLVHWGPKGSKAAVGLLPRLGIKPASIPGNFARHSASSTVSSSDKGTLVYHGGPVLHASAPYLIFWDPNGEITTSEKAHLEQYFVDTANDSQILPAVSSNIFGVDRQYTDTTGFADYTQAWSLSHAITDPQAYPSAGQCDVSSRVPVGTCLFDSQIQSEVARVINARSLPTGTSGSAPIYFVVTPPSVDTCNDGGITVCADNFYCAYHGIFSSSGHDILYADMPTYLDFHDPKGCQSDGNTQVQAPNGDQITDVVTSSMSHEFSETITDPITDSSLGKGGWYDPISGNEDGDNCAFIGTPSDPVDPAKGYSPDAFAPTLGGSASAGTLYDQLINGGHYYTQTEWSNGNLDCEAKPATATLSAAFSAPPTAAPDTAVSFDGAGSSSSAGYSSTTWDFGDGTTAFATGGPSQITHYFRSNGTFHVRLTIVDAYGNLNESAPQTVTVSGIGAYFPYAPAQPPQMNTPVTFDGSQSVDSIGTITNYRWSVDNVDIQTGSSPTFGYSFGSSGSHTVKLTVTDGSNSASWTQPVIVDAPPSAAFSVTTLNPDAGTPVVFDGSASSETNGSIVSYSWDYGDGSGPDTGANPSHTYASAGTYSVTLTVTDQDGYTAQITRPVVVDSPPTPAFSVSSGPRAGAPVTFDGSASNEPGGSIASYRWSYGDGSVAGSGRATTHTYAAPGAYLVTLTVTDAKGRTSGAAQNVTVAAASALPPPEIVGSPSAVISVATRHPIAGATVAFSGSGSSDQGSTLVAYNWSFGDRGSATGAAPGHRFAHPGTYAVALTVRDATGTTATTVRRVTVRSAGITGVKVKKGKTVERLTVSLSGPGTLTSGKLKFKIKRSGNRVVKYTLSRLQRHRLRSHHAVTLSLKLRFSPVVGSASSRTVRFKLSP